MSKFYKEYSSIIVLFAVFLCGAGVATAGKYYFSNTSVESGVSSKNDGQYNDQLETSTSTDENLNKTDELATLLEVNEDKENVADQAKTDAVSSAPNKEDGSILVNTQNNNSEVVESSGSDVISIKGELLSALGSDLDEFRTLLNNVKQSRIQWTALSEDVNNQRANSLKDYTLVSDFTELKNFANNNIKYYQNKASNAEKMYLDFYTPLEDAIFSQIQKTEALQKQVWDTLPDNTLQTNTLNLIEENSKQKDRFIFLAQEINKGNAGLENGDSEDFVEIVLGGIDKILDMYDTNSNLESKYEELEFEASQASVNVPFTCWAETTTQGGILSGKYNTRITCR